MASTEELRVNKATFRVTLPAALVAIAWAGAAGAQPSGLAQCRTLQSPDKRLACYDALPIVSDVPAAQPSVEERRRNMGLHASPVQRASELKELSVTAQISQVSIGAGGYPVLSLDNGQVWRTTSHEGLGSWLEQGQTATIKKSGVGGYRLYVSGVKGMETVLRVR
jgi:hypothetical protein